MSVGGVEHPGAARATVGTATVCGEVPRGEVVPVAPDQRGAAGMAIGALPGLVVDVAGKDVTQTRRERVVGYGAWMIEDTAAAA